MGAGMSKANLPTSSGTEEASGAVGQGAPNCPVCGGIGYVRREVPLDHPDFGRLFPCSCRTEELRARRLQALRTMSSLEHLERFTFATFHPEGHGLSPEQQANLHSVYDRAREFAQRPDGWLVLCGGYGCGKTHLALAIANACVEQGLPVLFLTVPDLLDYLRAAFAPGATQSYDERFEEIRSAPLLILDDLGTEQSTSWALEKLFQLLNFRYMNRLPTVITTNQEVEDLEPRLRSRLADVEVVQIARIVAPDYRQAGTGQSHADLNTLPLYAGMTFDNFDLRQTDPECEHSENLRRAVEIAQAFALAPAGWLTFTGPFGCGKTHLAAAIANERARLGQTVLFIVVPDLLDYLRAAFSPQSTIPYDKRFDEVRRAPFLVLDDLGTESATPWAQEKLYQLFNFRYVSRLPTVITTAKPIEALDAKLRTRMLDATRSMIFAITAPPYLGGPSRPRAKAPRQKRSGSGDKS